MISTPNFPCVGGLQLFEFKYILFLLGDRSDSYSVLSAGVFTVRESFCWLTDRVRTLLFLQECLQFGSVLEYNR